MRSIFISALLLGRELPVAWTDMEQEIVSGALEELNAPGFAGRFSVHPHVIH
jgi:hypothetical protein